MGVVRARDCPLAGDVTLGNLANPGKRVAEAPGI
jgi:hypothetical protein